MKMIPIIRLKKLDELTDKQIIYLARNGFLMWNYQNAKHRLMEGKKIPGAKLTHTKIKLPSWYKKG